MPVAIMDYPELCSMEMDELNLDDLFLGGDGEGAMGGVNADILGGGGGHGSAIAASLFADMDLDLGSIMDGIMGMEENTPAGSTANRGGGRGNGAAGMEDFDSNSLRGMMMLDDDFMGGGVDFDDIGSNNAVSGGGISRRRRSSANSIYSSGRGMGGGGDSPVAGLNKKAKRTRTARSNPHHASAAMKQPQLRLQQSKEVTSLVRSSASPSSATSVKLRRGDLSSVMLHSTRIKEAMIVHHRDSNQQQKHNGEFEPPASLFQFKQCAPEKQQPRSKSSGIMSEGKQREEMRLLKLRKYENSLSSFGLSSSRTLFYPYMKLPTNTLECKIQRGQKSLYPILENFSALLEQSPISNADNVDITTARNASNTISINHELDKDSVPSSSSISPLNDQSKSAITLSSPIYALFQNTLATLPSELIELLKNCTEAVGSTLQHREKAMKRKNSQEPSRLIDELVKIYLRNMKQLAFLRQNAINMENWCKDHFTSDDVRLIFPVDRKPMEQVFNSVWVHDKEQTTTRIQQLHQPQEEPPETEGRGGGRRVSGTYAKAIITTPITISIEVKVKVSGWRDKSSTKLKANLACPERWKVAMDRGSSTAATPTSFLDLSSFSTKTLDKAAEEMLRLDVLPLRKRTSVPVASSSLPVETVSNDSLSETTKIDKDLLESCSDSGAMIDNVDGKAKRRRKSKKDGVVSASPRLRGAAPSDSSSDKKNAFQICSSRVKGFGAFIPHNPGSNKPRNLRRNLTNELHIVDGGRTGEKSSGAFIYEEGQHIVHTLYNSILRPSVKPAKRRALLAEEVSSALLRLNQQKHEHRVCISPSNTISDQLPTQLFDSDAAYAEGENRMPAICNTVEMWRCLEESNYFEDLEKEEEVAKSLELLWQSETLENMVKEDGGYYVWGSLPQKLFANPMDKHIAGKENGDKSRETIETESPLFDHLQSLLVEVEDSEADDGCDADFDDDYLVANLPPYSSDEFINGPKAGDSNEGTESGIVGKCDTDTEEHYGGDSIALLDQSTLTLDQRTHIHLCAARLIDSKWTLSHRYSPSSHSTSINETREKDNDDDEEEHIETILHEMKDRLSNLRNGTNAQIKEFHHTAVSLSPSPV